MNRIAGFSVGTHYFLPGFPEMAWAMMAWALDTKHRALFRDHLPFEEAIIVTGAGESDLLDIMNAVVRDYPDCKLSSLPTWSGTGARVIELAVRGERGARGRRHGATCARRSRSWATPSRTGRRGRPP